jgi:phosphate:Na+ symporter
MNGIILAGNFAGGLGLLTLALALLTDGMRLAGGSVLKANLRRWAEVPWRAFETGLAIALLVPSSAASTRAAAGFVNSGLVKLENAIWLSVGVSFGSVVTAWLIVAAGLSPNAFALGLALVGLGALLRSGLRGRRKAVGKALTGFGLLFIGVAILSDAFQRGVPQGLPPAPFGLIGTSFLFLLLGAALATILRSASVAVAAAMVAAASGAVELPEAMAFIAGANLGPIAWAMWVIGGGTAQARRVALSHALFHAAGTVVALALLFFTAPMHARFALSMGAPFALASYHLAFQVLAALLLIPAAPRLLVFVQRHFTKIEFERGTSPHLDHSLLAVPDLAIEGFLNEVQQLFEQSRGLAHLTLRDRVVSEQRLRQDGDDLDSPVRALDATAARLIAGDVPADLAPIQVELPRASAGLRQLLESLVRFRGYARIPETGLDPRTRTRLRQLELAVLHLVEGSDALDPAFDAARCAQETETTLHHLSEVRRRIHEACGAGELHPTWADPLCGRLSSLERVASHASEVALGMDRIFAPVGHDEPFAEGEESTVARWLRKVA